MRYTTKVALSIRGDRVEKGREIELSSEEVSRFDQNDIEPVNPTPSEEAPPEPETPIEEMTLSELRRKAEALGLSSSGSKADLQERISLHLSDGTISN